MLLANAARVVGKEHHLFAFEQGQIARRLVGSRAHIVAVCGPHCAATEAHDEEKNDFSHYILIRGCDSKGKINLGNKHHFGSIFFLFDVRKGR